MVNTRGKISFPHYIFIPEEKIQLIMIINITWEIGISQNSWENINYRKRTGSTSQGRGCCKIRYGSQGKPVWECGIWAFEHRWGSKPGGQMSRCPADGRNNKCKGPEEYLGISWESKEASVPETGWLEKNMRPERKERTDLVRICKPLQKLPFFKKGNMKPLEFCAEKWQDLTYRGELHCGCYVKSRLWAGKVKQKDLLGSYWTNSSDRWWWLVSNSGEEFLAKVIKSGVDCIYILKVETAEFAGWW